MPVLKWKFNIVVQNLQKLLNKRLNCNKKKFKRFRQTLEVFYWSRPTNTKTSSFITLLKSFSLFSLIIIFKQASFYAAARKILKNSRLAMKEKIFTVQLTSDLCRHMQIKSSNVCLFHKSRLLIQRRFRSEHKLG